MATRQTILKIIESALIKSILKSIRILDESVKEADSETKVALIDLILKSTESLAGIVGSSLELEKLVDEYKFKYESKIGEIGEVESEIGEVESEIGEVEVGWLRQCQFICLCLLCYVFLFYYFFLRNQTDFVFWLYQLFI